MSDTTNDKRRPLPPVGRVGRCILRLLHWTRRRWWQLLIAALVVLAALVVTTEYVTSRSGFCGSCHNMRPYHASWRKDVHSGEGVICVDCHYAPGEQHTVQAKLKGLSRLASYTAGAFGSGRLRGHVSSASCTTADCHPLEGLKTKPYVFPKLPNGDGGASSPPTSPHSLRPFTHEKHLGKLPNGQELQCATCHEHRAGEAHMATYREACYLCHFNQKLFNTDRARCLLCHKLPEKAIQRSGQDPLTHQAVFDRKVPCAGCHAAYVRGGGPVHKERCRACHDQPGLLAAWELVKPHAHATKAETEACEACQKALRSKVEMHETHVATQMANCFDCHIEIQHGPAPSGLETVRADCQFCHGQSHSATVALLEGRSGIGKPDGKLTPHAMLSSHTVCTGCHTEKGLDHMQREVLTGGAGSCKACHGPEHTVFESWQRTTAKAQREAHELQAAGREALKKAESAGGLTPQQLARFKQRLAEADRRLTYLKQAGALHNQKLAIRLFDEAMDIYEDAIDAIKAAGK